MRRFLGAALLALAAGCATSPTVSPIIAQPVEAWTLQGRIGVQSGEQSLSGNVRWRHLPDLDEVLITSPLGQGVARIVRDEAGVVLEVPNQPPRRAPDAEALTQEALGYALPVSGLVWWVQGRPDPRTPHESRHAPDGRLERLDQDGWVIRYLQYTAEGRPRKLLVARRDLEIRLIADRWDE